VMIESATWWKNGPEIQSGESRTEDIGTEVFFLPAAAHTEKSGSFTNTQRLLQWHHQAVEPAGDARSDLQFTYDLGRRIRAAAGRRHGDGPAASGFQLRPVHREQPVNEQPGYLAQQSGPPLDQNVERRLAKVQQVAVPDRANRGRPRPTAEQRDLPGDSSAGQIVQDVLARARGHEYSQTSAGHQKQTICWFALGDHHLAGRYVHGLELCRKLAPGRPVQPGEERDSGKKCVKLRRIMRAGHVVRVACSRPG